MSSRPFNILFTERNSSYVIYQLIKALGINNSMVFNFTISLYFLTLVVIAQICNPTVELAIPVEIPTKEPKAKFNLKLYKLFNACYSLNHSSLFLQ